MGRVSCPLDHCPPLFLSNFFTLYANLLWHKASSCEWWQQTIYKQHVISYLPQILMIHHQFHNPFSWDEPISVTYGIQETQSHFGYGFYSLQIPICIWRECIPVQTSIAKSNFLFFFRNKQDTRKMLYSIAIYDRTRFMWNYNQIQQIWNLYIAIFHAKAYILIHTTENLVLGKHVTSSLYLSLGTWLHIPIAKKGCGS